MSLIERALVAIAVALGSASVAQSQPPSLSETPSVDPQVAPGTFSALSRRLMPAVVNISTSQTIAPRGGLPEFPDGSPLERFNEFFGRDGDGFRREGSLGSGFVISPDGIIVTNNHVIEGADEIEATFANGETLRARLLGRDSDTDLAVLQVDYADPLPYVDFADSDAAEVGDWVIAIGNPFGFGGSVSQGIISAVGRDIQAGRYDDFIQTDAAINRGNSGGPLFNLGGEVLGVNTAIISPTGGSVGIGFSIPANLASRIVDQILEYGAPRRGWLGVNVQGVDGGLAAAYGLASDEGVIVTHIAEDGPAEAAGLEIGDLLLTFNGSQIEDTKSLTRIVADTEIGRRVTVDYVRDGRRSTARVTLGELESADVDEDAQRDPIPQSALTNNPLGVEFATVTQQARRRFGIESDVEGVLVNNVAPNGPSAGKLRRGDVIVEMFFEPVSGPADALEALDAARGENAPMLLRVHRRGLEVFYSIELDFTS